MARGNCYVAAEALYHIFGGKRSGWIPMVIPRSKSRKDTHWFLLRRPWARCPDWAIQIIDPSRLQFRSKLPPYHLAHGCGFLTKQPSRKAQKLIHQLTWQED